MSDFFVGYTYALHLQDITNKSTCLRLFFGAFDGYHPIPAIVRLNLPKHRIITSSGQRSHISQPLLPTTSTVVLDFDTYGTFDALQHIPNVGSLEITIDCSCEASIPEFMSFVNSALESIQFSTRFPIKLSLWSQNILIPAPFAQIISTLQSISAQVSLRKISLHMNTQYTSITAALLSLSSSTNDIPHIKLIFDSSPYISINKEKSQSLLSALLNLKAMKNLTIHCTGHSSFTAVKHLFNSTEQQANLTFNLDSFSFNLECEDFVPEPNDLLELLPRFLENNPIVKFRAKFPFEMEYNSPLYARAIKEIFETYPFIFSDCTKIASFHIGTSGNKSYTAKSSPQSEWEQTKSHTRTNSMTKSILKKSSIVTETTVMIDVLASVRFLRKQENLKQIYIKVDRPINLEELGQIISANQKTLTIISIRVRNNAYNREEINRFLKTIQLVFGLTRLQLDIQAVEYVLFKLSGSSVSRMVQYKQGRSVLNATMFTQDIHFECSPVKLFQHYMAFKSLIRFSGKFTGFQYAKDYEKALEKPEHVLKCIDVAQNCEKMFHQMLFYRKLLTSMILFMSTKTQWQKEVIRDALILAYASLPSKKVEIMNDNSVESSQSDYDDHSSTS